MIISAWLYPYWLSQLTNGLYLTGTDQAWCTVITSQLPVTGHNQQSSQDEPSRLFNGNKRIEQDWTNVLEEGRSIRLLISPGEIKSQIID